MDDKGGDLVARWGAARRILAVRLDSMGDVLMTTPALAALKSKGARVTLLTSPSGAAAGRLCPWVDEIIVHEAPWMKATAPRGPEPDLALIERLRAESFDAAVIFTVYSQNPMPAILFAFLAGIPLRLAHARENPYQLLTPHVAEPEPEGGVRHEVRRQLDLVAAVGFVPEDERMAIRVGADAEAAVDRLLDREGLNGHERWLVLHQGATAPSRRYPHFAPAMASLEALGWRFLLSGDASEASDIDALIAASGTSARSLAGQLSLEELAALIARAPIVISNNSGPAHMAAAVGTPVVDLYALTNPQHTPWAVPSRVLNHDVPCRWCYKSVCPMVHHHCLSLVAPDAVVEAAIKLHGEAAAFLPA